MAQGACARQPVHRDVSEALKKFASFVGSGKEAAATSGRWSSRRLNDLSRALATLEALHATGRMGPTGEPYLRQFRNDPRARRGSYIDAQPSNRPSSKADDGFAVSSSGAGTRTQGVVLCNQPRALDLRARNARFVERVPQFIMGEVLAGSPAHLFGTFAPQSHFCPRTPPPKTSSFRLFFHTPSHSPPTTSPIFPTRRF